MKDWVERLRMVLTMNQRSVLEDAGRISHELAKRKASEEYEKYKKNLLAEEHLDSLKELDNDIRLLKESSKG